MGCAPPVPLELLLSGRLSGVLELSAPPASAAAGAAGLFAAVLFTLEPERTTAARALHISLLSRSMYEYY